MRENLVSCGFLALRGDALSLNGSLADSSLHAVPLISFVAHGSYCSQSAAGHDTQRERASTVPVIKT